jgi:hypothetical protein
VIQQVINRSFSKYIKKNANANNGKKDGTAKRV